MANRSTGRSRSLLRPARYQLNKHAARVVASGHPWIFRRHMSTAASVFEDGQWLRLVDGENQGVGYGFYQQEGAIAIRILAKGPDPVGGVAIRERLDRALARRAALRVETNAYRAVHGESDRLPAVTADVYDRVAVVASYAVGADPVARLVARHLQKRLDLEGVQWRRARRRVESTARAESQSRPRTLFGNVPETVRIEEGGQALVVDLRSGQKSGAFLDLRGLRRRLRASSLDGARVLDGFAYTGSLGSAALGGGAAEVWHVESSPRAVALGKAEAPDDRWIEADLFEWLPELDPGERFDLAILDPPQMTSRARQVPRALHAYRKLYQALRPHINEGGTVIACCCTSRIEEASFRTTVEQALGEGFTFVERLKPERDHPVGFAEADYLKVLVYRR